MKVFEDMLHQLEVLIRKNEVEQSKKRQAAANRGEGPPVVLGGQLVDEQDFEDENLCNICCFSKIDTEFVPC